MGGGLVRGVVVGVRWGLVRKEAGNRDGETLMENIERDRTLS